MNNLRRKFERFCFANRDKGIPNLMLYISVGTAIVYLMSMFDRSSTLYYALCFDRAKILQGQVWRLFTYIFTYGLGNNILLVLISLFCYFTLGRAMESSWGSLRFTLFYFSGVVLMDVYAMLFNAYANVYYLNLSLLIGYATLYPDSRFIFLFIIPVKAWIFGLIDLALTLYDVYLYAALGAPFTVCIFPLVAIANYFLFFGKDVLNLLPHSWRARIRKKPTHRKAPAAPQEPIPFRKTAQAVPYTHKCTVCGRTDISNPEMEFRYCSRCNGYHCYCEEHISNHSHIQ